MKLVSALSALIPILLLLGCNTVAQFNSVSQAVQTAHPSAQQVQVSAFGDTISNTKILKVTLLNSGYDALASDEQEAKALDIAKIAWQNTPDAAASYTGVSIIFTAAEKDGIVTKSMSSSHKFEAADL